VRLATESVVADAAVVAAVVLGYALGTFPSALLAGRRRGVDPTQRGSRNPGTTNVLRTAGRRAALLTLAGDAGKGALAATLGWLVGGHGVGVVCGAAAVVGHVAPLGRGFRGGKGVATGAGMALVLFPGPTLVAGAGFVTVLVLTGVVSAASLTATVLVVVGAAVAGTPIWEVVLLAAGAGLVIYRHGDNLRRLAHGQERRTRLRR
jgi:acyl phosphate:glycerol-3-phosphate acyltransferase